jgi:chromosome segregation ATPase
MEMTFNRGCVLPAHSRVPDAVLDRWITGLAKEPDLETVLRPDATAVVLSALVELQTLRARSAAEVAALFEQVTGAQDDLIRAADAEILRLRAAERTNTVHVGELCEVIAEQRDDVARLRDEVVDAKLAAERDWATAKEMQEHVAGLRERLREQQTTIEHQRQLIELNMAAVAAQSPEVSPDEQ